MRNNLCIFFRKIFRINVKLNFYLTVTKIKQERTNHDRTKIGPFFDFTLHFSIFKNEGENLRKDRSWYYLDKKGPRFVF